MLMVLKAGAHLPGWFWRPVSVIGAAVLVLRPNRTVRQWQLNYERVQGRAPGPRATYRAMTGWMENTMISLQLAGWSERRIRRRIVLENPDAWERLKAVHEEGGIVAALPHMGSWDLVGAFACLEGLPVSSVAEGLPDGQFEYFRDLRSRLGFRIYNVKDRSVFPRLRADLDEGRVVCLVADRDFSRRGVPVTWQLPGGDAEITMPPGAGLLAQQSHRPLFGVVTWFDRLGRLHVLVTEPLKVAHGADGLPLIMQELADFFSEQVSGHTVSWLMLQRFFKGVSA
ncbi:LpxL/LpxP family acyltransferase [Propionibacterium australiense]|uniref:Bacterial lipid A biosynthesis acyltransferase n=1 Tax=Propionibacterium australiense TaxID=119981 RepID=A0A383S8N9_9ACTN|nr:hypothetical protein [Propionibacterium australiense]RLP06878.1 hypothetical protein D9T14_11150 [Propionibacterium australiense]RLP08852.1 hypothetical protein D7U36_08490 [Propionibacterium australiense]SYZ34338.1 Bacterial lipid A biosynthesis acyltransferase [Propionibacterium australiense]VEH90068.1 Phosphatidylinositol mannoside acyltransferase [Propionibacterium australiense]